MTNIWTEENDLFLKNNYPEKGSLWCAKYLNIKRSAVNSRVHKLGIRSNRYNNEKNEEKFIVLVISKNGKPLWDKWLGTHHKHLIECQTCGYKWNCYPVNVIKKNRPNWCPVCSRKTAAKKRRKCSESDYHSLAKKHGGMWTGKIVPSTMKFKTTWVCKIGHKSFYSSYRQILTYDFLPCPDCKRPWIGQTISKLYFERFTGLNFISVRPNFLKYITGSKLELDGFNEKESVAFEYNGIGHYFKDPRQTEKDFNKLQERDVWKYNKIRERGIRLLIIKESNKGVCPEQIREEILNFIIKNNLPLVSDFKSIFVNPAEIYLIDPRDELMENAKKINLVLMSDIYINRNTSLLFKCLLCNENKNATPYEISRAVSKGRANYCNKCSNLMPFTKERVIEYCNALNLTLISKQIGRAHDKIDAICNICNEKNSIKAAILYRMVKENKTSYCPTCSKKRKRSIESINEEIAIHGFKIISKNIINVDTPLEIRYPNGTVKNRSYSYIKRLIGKKLIKKNRYGF